MSVPCFYCGASPYAGCRHQVAVERPHFVEKRSKLEETGVDLRNCHNAWARWHTVTQKRDATAEIEKLKTMLKPLNQLQEQARG